MRQNILIPTLPFRLLNNLGEAILCLSETQEILFINSAATDITGPVTLATYLPDIISRIIDENGNNVYASKWFNRKQPLTQLGIEFNMLPLQWLKIMCHRAEMEEDGFEGYLVTMKRMDYLSTLFEKMDRGYAILNKQLTLEYYNECIDRLITWLHHKPLKRGLDARYFILPEFVERADALLQEALSGKTNEIICENDITKNKGVFSINIAPFVQGSKIEGVIICFQDITERHMAATELKKSIERFEIVAELVNELVWEFIPNSGWLHFNPSRLNALYNVQVNSPIQMGEFLKIYLHPEEVTSYIKQMNDASNNGSTMASFPVNRFIKPDGSIVYTRTFVRMIRNAAGDVEKVIGVTYDHTKEYLASKEIKKSNERFEVISKISNDLLWEFYAIPDLIYFNEERLFELFNVHHKSPDSLMGFMNSVLHPDDFLAYVSNVEMAYETKNPKLDFPVFRYVQSDGNFKYAKITGQVFFNEEGEIEKVIGVTRDVTIAYTAELELKKSNERYELAGQASYDLIWERNIQDNFYHFNEALLTNFGYNHLEEWPQSRFYDEILHPDDKEMIMNHARNFYSQKLKNFSYPIHRFLKKDGTTAYVDVRCIAIYSEDGTPIKTVGVARDISARYLSEEALRKSNERFNLAAHASFDLIWDIDIATNIISFNDLIESMWGHPMYDSMPLPDFMMKLIHPDDQKWVYDRFVTFIKSSETQMEIPVHRVVKKNGENAYVMVRVLAIRRPDNYMIRMIGVTRDITENHLAEQKLLVSNERYELIASATSDIIWEWTISNNSLFFWNDSFFKLFGYKAHNTHTTIEWRNEKIHPDDQKKVQKKIQASFQSKKTVLNLQYRFMDTLGRYHNILDRAFINYDADGNPVKITGAMQDISEVKELEAKLQKEALFHQQQVTEVTIQTQEKEREEIGRELHDNINQLLAIVMVYLSVIKADQENADIIQKSRNLVDSAIQEIRKLSKKLISPVLDMGLDDAMTMLFLDSGIATGIKFHFVSKKFDLSKVPRHLQLMLYRIVQEEVNNIIKHSKASEVRATLKVSKHHISITMKDNGIGFDTHKKSAGVGIRNMRSRAILYNGTLSIDSEPGKGCSIEIKVPLQNKYY